MASRTEPGEIGGALRSSKAQRRPTRWKGASWSRLDAHFWKARQPSGPEPRKIIPGFRELFPRGRRGSAGPAGARQRRERSSRWAGPGAGEDKAAGTLTAAAPLRSPAELSAPAHRRQPPDPSPPLPADDTRSFRKRHIRRQPRPLQLICQFHSPDLRSREKKLVGGRGWQRHLRRS